MKHAISRVMFKNDCPVQTLLGSPQGQSSQFHHVSNKSLSITYDDATGLIEFAGWGNRRATHVSNIREMDFVPAEAPKAAVKGAA